MKHNIKVTAILIAMFVITQLIGLFVIYVYNNENNVLPYGMQPPPEIQNSEENMCSSLPTYTQVFSCLFKDFSWTLVFSFIIAIAVLMFLTRFKFDNFLKLWFFAVIILALGLSLKALVLFKFKDIIIINKIPILSVLIPELSLFSFGIFLLISLPLAYIKIFKRNILVHNITELLVYPGIAAVLVPVLNVFGIVLFLLLISLYDIWAVWHSQFMQNMAKYQINTLRIFTGFFIPYADAKEKLKIENIKEKFKNKSEKFLDEKFKKAKIKVHLAILGGGDIVFPIITAGVFYKIYHSFIPPLIIMFFATLALLYLFVFAQKGKFYPAMPFLSIGMYIGMILTWILMALNII